MFFNILFLLYLQIFFITFVNESIEAVLIFTFQRFCQIFEIIFRLLHSPFFNKAIQSWQK